MGQGAIALVSFSPLHALLLKNKRVGLLIASKKSDFLHVEWKGFLISQN